MPCQVQQRHEKGAQVAADKPGKVGVRGPPCPPDGQAPLQSIQRGCEIGLGFIIFAPRGKRPGCLAAPDRQIVQGNLNICRHLANTLGHKVSLQLSGATREVSKHGE